MRDSAKYGQRRHKRGEKSREKDKGKKQLVDALSAFLRPAPSGRVATPLAHAKQCRKSKYLYHCSVVTSALDSAVDTCQSFAVVENLLPSSSRLRRDLIASARST